jgi:hypothetical protein
MDYNIDFAQGYLSRKPQLSKGEAISAEVV